MPQGLEIRDANGNIVFDTKTRLGKVIGVITVTAFGSGSVTVPAFTGTLFTAIQSLEFLPRTGSQITISGNIINWTYQPARGMTTVAPHLIFYGFY